VAARPAHGSLALPSVFRASSTGYPLFTTNLLV